MNRNYLLAGPVVLALIGVTAAALIHVNTHRHLGAPGVRTRPLAGSHNLEVVLPASAAGWTSEIRPESDTVVKTLPSDTSFGQRVYKAEDGLQITANVVLMGTDRTSIHKPEICLTGQGWQIDQAESQVKLLHLDRPLAYDLPVMRMVGTLETKDNRGQHVTLRGVYTYWFVDADRFTARHNDRMWWMARDVLMTGVLDRWAYVSFFAYGVPGQEDALFERMKQLIATTVPDFQLVPASAK